MKNKKELTAAIEEAASRFANNNWSPEDNRYPSCENSFEAGALSDSAKAYHQEGMCTKEEVKKMCWVAVEEFNQTCSSGSFSFDFNRWLNLIKKK